MKVLVITGSTASGKSEVGIDLAKRFNGEIISCDSVQVYRGLDIGSAKVMDRQGVVHHLLDIMDVDEQMSVQLFQGLAREKIEEISSRGKLPILVGGTGFYLKAILYDYQFDDEKRVEDDFDEWSNEALHLKLKELDPVEFEKIHVNNRKRLLRVHRLMASQGTTRSRLIERQSSEPLYDHLVYVLGFPRDVLHERIEARVDEMFELGLLSEVENLLLEYPDLFDFSSMSAIGYREFRDYFKGEISLGEVRDLIVVHTRQFAKRQLTWFRHQLDGVVVDMSESYDFESDVSKFLSE